MRDNNADILFSDKHNTHNVALKFYFQEYKKTTLHLILYSTMQTP